MQSGRFLPRHFLAVTLTVALAAALILGFSPAAKAGPVTWPKDGLFHNPVVVMYTTNAACSYGCGSGQDMEADTKVDLYVLLPGADGVSLHDSSGPMGTFNSSAVHLTAEMHIRGQSTLTNSKSQFSVKLTSDWPSGQANGNFMGMPFGGKHWVFNAPGARDQTFIRNVMAFDMQRTLGENTGSNAWAPRTKYFEFFAVFNPDGSRPLNVANVQNGYMGCYINFEHVRAESHRVPIPDSYAPVKGTPVGGVLLQINPEDPTERLDILGANLAGSSTPTFLYWPKLADFSGAGGQEQLDAIQDWFYDDGGTSGTPSGWAYYFMRGCTSGPPDFTLQPSQCPGCTDEDSYWSLVTAATDFQSMAEYLLLNEVAKDPDGFHKSTFMYRKPDSLDKAGKVVSGKLYGGPMWDKNKSYSLGTYGGTFDSPEGWLFSAQKCGQAPYWWPVLSTYGPFGDAVTKVWNQAQDRNKGALSYHRIAEFVHEQRNTLLGAPPATLPNPPNGMYIRDQQLWHAMDPNTAATNLNNKIKHILSFINKRLVWMGDNLANLDQAVPGDCQ